MDFLRFNGCKIRLWCNELPSAFYSVERMIEISFEANAPSLNQDRSAAIELYKLQGARAHYGLLGATLSPGSTPCLELKVCISFKDHGQLLADTIAHKAEDVHLGLPNEFTTCIIDGASEAVSRLKEIPTGQILFNCAAHSLFSSSEAVFGRLSTTIINMLCLPEEDISTLRELCMEI